MSRIESLIIKTEYVGLLVQTLLRSKSDGFREADAEVLETQVLLQACQVLVSQNLDVDAAVVFGDDATDAGDLLRQAVADVNRIFAAHFGALSDNVEAEAFHHDVVEDDVQLEGKVLDMGNFVGVVFDVLCGDAAFGRNHLFYIQFAVFDITAYVQRFNGESLAEAVFVGLRQSIVFVENNLTSADAGLVGGKGKNAGRQHIDGRNQFTGSKELSCVFQSDAQCHGGRFRILLQHDVVDTIDAIRCGNRNGNFFFHVDVQRIAGENQRNFFVRKIVGESFESGRQRGIA